MKAINSTSSDFVKTNRQTFVNLQGALIKISEFENQPLRYPHAWFSLLVVSIFLLGFSKAYSQSPELIKPLSADQQREMNQTQIQRVEKIRQRSTTQSSTLVFVDINALSGEKTRITLPNDTTLDFSKSKIDIRSANNFIWYGKLSDIRGQSTMVIQDGNITGTIIDGDNLYRIEPIGNGIHILIRVDKSRFPPDHPSSFEEIEARSVPKLNIYKIHDVSKDMNPVNIDVLVAYTPAASAAVGNIVSTIQLAVAEANQSYLNSLINITLTLVDNFEVSYSETGKSYNTILHDFVGMAEVNTRRNNSCADMAVLIIDQSDFCGLADAIMADASSAFAVVHYDCATGYYSFAHELGHLQGARHDPVSDPNTTPFTYGHGFQQTSSSPSWRTIMAYNCAGGCIRLQYWSNPNVTYSGIAMGTATVSDNARVLNETATTVASFMNCSASMPSIFSISLHSGISIPTGSFASTYSNGVNFIFDAGLRISNSLELVAYAGINKFKSEVTGIADNQVINLNLNLKYSKDLPHTMPRPPLWYYYIQGGPGIYIPKTGNTQFGLNVGAGFGYRVGTHWRFEIGTDYHLTFNDIQFSANHAGVIFNF